MARLDAALGEPARLGVYGSAALMSMGEEDRFSVDVDMAGPYSTVNERALAAVSYLLSALLLSWVASSCEARAAFSRSSRLSVRLAII